MHNLAQNNLPALLTFGLLSILFAAPSDVFGQDWAHWRGPEQSGVSRETNLVEDWSLEPRKNVAWVAETGGRATPVVLNGRVYLNCRTTDDVNDPIEKVHSREQVICWDLETGDELWRCLLYTSPSPRDATLSRMPSSA